MSPNKDKPHVLVLPEDDANRQLANGFHLEVPFTQQRQMQVLPVAGGWHRVLDLFQSTHAPEMDRHPHRFVVLLIDFDNQQGQRMQQARQRIPGHLIDRVFVLGASDEPEDLTTLGSFEEVGSRLARECRDGAEATWGNDVLRHNANELARLRHQLLPILFV
jgi:hypothetical protein